MTVYISACSNDLLCNLGKANDRVNAQPRVFVPTPMWYESIHVNRCFDVEHGRDHLITGH
jgi:hypothetical protein